MISQSLFDNRYRYDHIYPRGRSGETMRAYDTQDQDRPVVIKRPAPQDAPPLRAAQEVSILTEKRALERVGHHAVVTALRGSGSFRVGGSSYHYIVMDRAEGETVEEMVLNLRTLPELELLTIVDRLLDMLAEAHAQNVVYNDVDAKHLFWDREAYRLKVIDWGNAVFTDEPNPSITPAHDIYQVGELLYFLYQGGARLASETTPDGEYLVTFGEHTPEAMQNLITRATHPNIKSRRFPSIRSLREAFANYRQPIEKARNQHLQDIKNRLVSQASRTTLEGLEAEIAEVLALDPGYPEARRVQAEIRLRLKQLAVQADFEATRIYLETGNWSRAVRLMEELIPNADPYTASVLTFLVAAAEQLQNEQQTTLPTHFEQVINLLLDRKIQEAINTLVGYQDMRVVRWLIAERLVTILPGFTLLPAHLTRLAHDIPAAAVWMQSPDLPIGIAPLLEWYGKMAIQLADLDHPAAERAENATRQVISLVRQVSDSFYSSPPSAQTALDQAIALDPENRALQAVPDYLSEARAELQNLAGFRPTTDAASLESWFEEAQTALQPYQDLTDPNFQAITRTLADTLNYWFAVGDMLAMGRQRPSIDRLRKMAAAVRPYNTLVAEWFEKTARLIQDGTIIESFSPNKALSELLVEGYRAWDQGQSGRAADTARRALPLANTPGEQLAVERLQRLTEITNTWLNSGNVSDAKLTDESESAALALLLEDEQHEFNRFTQQMKSDEVYLKAMKLGIVAHLKGSSSAGYRALCLHYVLRGVMAIQEDHLPDADFWRQATLIANPQWQTHPLFSAFDTALTRRKLVLRAQEGLNDMHSFAEIHGVRQVLNAPLAEEWLKDAQQAMNHLESTMKHWSDGDFRAARDAFNKTLESLALAEKNGNMQLDHLIQWITPYRDRAVELVEKRQIVEQAAMEGSLKPEVGVLRALEQIADISEATVGTENSRQVRLWRDLYKTMLRTHQNQDISKREKIAEFDINFAALFIDKHPAYRLFQRWYEAARALPDDVREDIQISVDTPYEMDSTVDAPRYTETVEEEGEELAPYLEETPDPYAEDDQRRGLPWNWIIAGAGIILVGLVAFGILNAVSQQEEPVTRFAATPTLDLGRPTQIDIVIQPSVAPASVTAIPPTNTLVLSTNTPTVMPTTAVPVIVPTIAPTLTPSQVVTIVTNTPPASLTPTALPASATPQGLAPDIGQSVDVLRVLNLIQPVDYGWDALFFNQGAGGVWQFGASVEAAGNAPIVVIIDPDFLETFNPDAGTRLRGAEVRTELTLYDESRVASQQVSFGLGLQNSRRQRYSAQVQLQPDGIVSLGMNENGTFRSRTQIPMRQIKVALSFQREDDGTVSFFVDGQLVGTSPALFPLDEPMSLVLYTDGGGMFVSVSSFDLRLAPYEE